MIRPSAPGASAARPYLDVADAIGCEIVRDAVWSGGRCGWLVWSMEPDDDGAYVSRVRAAGGDLYAGAAGIALFLAHLSAMTGDPHQRRTAKGAAVQVVASAAGQGAAGLFTGAIGAGWALVQAGTALDDSVMVEQGLGIVEAAAERPGRAGPAEQFDLLSGHAGDIVALVGVGRRCGRPGLVEAALRKADRLVAAAMRGPHGLSWPSPGFDHQDLLGLSHGTSGMALALFEAAAAAGRDDLRAAARACLAYERHHFDPARGAWPDFRTMPGQPSTGPSWPLAWCHGGVGIGLSRLRIRALEPGDREIDREIDTAVAAVTRSLEAGLPPSGDFSPCHGAVGLGELMLSVGQTLGRPEALAVARGLADAGIRLFHEPRRPWPCGVQNAGQTPSLMLGTAGIGLFYLRAEAPDAVPSVLLPTAETVAAPPPHRSAAA